MIETDVWLSKDGVVIVSHDPDFKRLCGVDKNLDEVDTKEFPEFLDSWNMDFSKKTFKRNSSD